MQKMVKFQLTCNCHNKIVLYNVDEDNNNNNVITMTCIYLICNSIIENIICFHFLIMSERSHSNGVMIV